MKDVRIPSTAGYATLAYSNVGEMNNEGWELNVSFNNFIKKGKFSASANFNVSQNFNKITEMDEKVLASINNEWSNKNGTYLNRVQVGNPLGSIYGYRYKGVYQYSYEYLANLKQENKWTAAQFESEINRRLANGETFPVAIDKNGKVMMNADGTPMHMVFDYATRNYEFKGGDAIYEDVNKDGQINQLDVVYLGNSMPKVNGGFGFNLKYGQFKLTIVSATR